MKLSKERLGEIALAMITQRMADDIPTGQQLKRGIPDEAKKLGIDQEELTAFNKEVLSKAVALRFNCSEVSLVFREK
jgi:hypothetical protein